MHCGWRVPDDGGGAAAFAQELRGGQQRVKSLHLQRLNDTDVHLPCVGARKVAHGLQPQGVIQQPGMICLSQVVLVPSGTALTALLPAGTPCDAHDGAHGARGIVHLPLLLELAADLQPVPHLHRHLCFLQRPAATQHSYAQQRQSHASSHEDCERSQIVRGRECRLDHVGGRPPRASLAEVGEEPA